MQRVLRDITVAIALLAMHGACGDSATNDSAWTTVPVSGGLTTASAGTGASTTGAGDTDGVDATSETGFGGSTGAAICGDGVIEGDEACDDGPSNHLGGACRPGCVLNVCGDGDLGPAEACDDGVDNGPDDACSSSCTINPSSCGKIVTTPTIEKEPLDVIFVIDNSNSMSQEIAGIQNNINENFADILKAAGLDATVVMLSKYSGGAPAPFIHGTCIESPLGGIAEGDCADPPADPGNTTTFHHYSKIINSTDAWCTILATGAGVDDEFGNSGWMKWLRKEAFKAFILVSDDAADCTYQQVSLYDNQFEDNNLDIARDFDDLLRTGNPSRFGDPDEPRRYTVHSLVGLAPSGDGEPYQPDQPTVLSTCPSAPEPGAGHQALSKLTGGLRFPVCDTDHYDKVFKALADSMIKGAKIACEFELPGAPDGKNLDLDSIDVRYHAMGDPNSYEFIPEVLNDAACAAGGFYLEESTLHLCPNTCGKVQEDDKAQIEVEFQCLPVIPG